jgi:HEAT repeat protein
LLGDRDADVVRLAAWALGAIGDDAATSALIPLLRHQQAGVRRAAAWALGMVAAGRS